MPNKSPLEQLVGASPLDQAVRAYVNDPNAQYKGQTPDPFAFSVHQSYLDPTTGRTKTATQIGRFDPTRMQSIDDIPDDVVYNTNNLQKNLLNKHLLDKRRGNDAEVKQLHPDDQKKYNYLSDYMKKKGYYKAEDGVDDEGFTTPFYEIDSKLQKKLEESRALDTNLRAIKQQWLLERGFNIDANKTPNESKPTQSPQIKTASDIFNEHKDALESIYKYNPEDKTYTVNREGISPLIEKLEWERYRRVLEKREKEGDWFDKSVGRMAASDEYQALKGGQELRKHGIFGSIAGLVAQLNPNRPHGVVARGLMGIKGIFEEGDKEDRALASRIDALHGIKGVLENSGKHILTFNKDELERDDTEFVGISEANIARIGKWSEKLGLGKIKEAMTGVGASSGGFASGAYEHGVVSFLPFRMLKDEPLDRYAVPTPQKVRSWMNALGGDLRQDSFWGETAPSTIGALAGDLVGPFKAGGVASKYAMNAERTAQGLWTAQGAFEKALRITKENPSWFGKLVNTARNPELWDEASKATKYGSQVAELLTKIPGLSTEAAIQWGIAEHIRQGGGATQDELSHAMRTGALFSVVGEAIGNSLGLAARESGKILALSGKFGSIAKSPEMYKALDNIRVLGYLGGQVLANPIQSRTGEAIDAEDGKGWETFFKAINNQDALDLISGIGLTGLHGFSNVQAYKDNQFSLERALDASRLEEARVDVEASIKAKQEQLKEEQISAVEPTVVKEEQVEVVPDTFVPIPDEDRLLVEQFEDVLPSPDAINRPAMNQDDVPLSMGELKKMAREEGVANTYTERGFTRENKDELSNAVIEHSNKTKEDQKPVDIKIQEQLTKDEVGSISLEDLVKDDFERLLKNSPDATIPDESLPEKLVPDDYPISQESLEKTGVSLKQEDIVKDNDEYDWKLRKQPLAIDTELSKDPIELERQKMTLAATYDFARRIGIPDENVRIIDAITTEEGVATGAYDKVSGLINLVLNKAGKTTVTHEKTHAWIDQFVRNNPNAEEAAKFQVDLDEAVSYLKESDAAEYSRLTDDALAEVFKVKREEATSEQLVQAEERAAEELFATKTEDVFAQAADGSININSNPVVKFLSGIWNKLKSLFGNATPEQLEKEALRHMSIVEAIHTGKLQPPVQRNVQPEMMFRKEDLDAGEAFYDKHRQPLSDSNFEAIKTEKGNTRLLSTIKQLTGMEGMSTSSVVERFHNEWKDYNTWSNTFGSLVAAESARRGEAVDPTSIQRKAEYLYSRMQRYEPNDDASIGIDLASGEVKVTRATGGQPIGGLSPISHRSDSPKYRERYAYAEFMTSKGFPLLSKRLSTHGVEGGTLGAVADMMNGVKFVTPAYVSIVNDVGLSSKTVRDRKLNDSMRFTNQGRARRSPDGERYSELEDWSLKRDTYDITSKAWGSGELNRKLFQQGYISMLHADKRVLLMDISQMQSNLFEKGIIDNKNQLIPNSNSLDFIASFENDLLRYALLSPDILGRKSGMLNTEYGNALNHLSITTKPNGDIGVHFKTSTEKGDVNVIPLDLGMEAGKAIRAFYEGGGSHITTGKVKVGDDYVNVSTLIRSGFESVPPEQKGVAIKAVQQFMTDKFLSLIDAMQMLHIDGSAGFAKLYKEKDGQIIGLAKRNEKYLSFNTSEGISPKPEVARRIYRELTIDAKGEKWDAAKIAQYRGLTVDGDNISARAYVFDPETWSQRFASNPDGTPLSDEDKTMWDNFLGYMSERVHDGAMLSIDEKTHKFIGRTGGAEGGSSHKFKRHGSDEVGTMVLKMATHLQLPDKTKELTVPQQMLVQLIDGLRANNVAYIVSNTGLKTGATHTPKRVTMGNEDFAIGAKGEIVGRYKSGGEEGGEIIEPLKGEDVKAGLGMYPTFHPKEMDALGKGGMSLHDDWGIVKVPLFGDDGMAWDAQAGEPHGKSAGAPFALPFFNPESDILRAKSPELKQALIQKYGTDNAYKAIEKFATNISTKAARVWKGYNALVDRYNNPIGDFRGEDEAVEFLELIKDRLDNTDELSANEQRLQSYLNDVIKYTPSGTEIRTDKLGSVLLMSEDVIEGWEGLAAVPRMDESGRGTVAMKSISELVEDATGFRSKGDIAVLGLNLFANQEVDRFLSYYYHSGSEPEPEGLRDVLMAHVDENTGAYRSYDNQTEHIAPQYQGVSVSRDLVQKHNLKPGQRVFVIKTPNDEAASFVPMIVAGMFDERIRNTLTFNDYLSADIHGSDHDIDKLSIMVNSKDWEDGDFDMLWATLTENEMHTGKTKRKIIEAKKKLSKQPLQMNEVEVDGQKVKVPLQPIDQPSTLEKVTGNSYSDFKHSYEPVGTTVPTPFSANYHFKAREFFSEKPIGKAAYFANKMGSYVQQLPGETIISTTIPTPTGNMPLNFKMAYNATRASIHIPNEKEGAVDTFTNHPHKYDEAAWAAHIFVDNYADKTPIEQRFIKELVLNRIDTFDKAQLRSLKRVGNPSIADVYKVLDRQGRDMWKSRFATLIQDMVKNGELTPNKAEEVLNGQLQVDYKYNGQAHLSLAARQSKTIGGTVSDALDSNPSLLKKELQRRSGSFVRDLLTKQKVEFGFPKQLIAPFQLEMESFAKQAWNWVTATNTQRRMDFTSPLRLTKGGENTEYRDNTIAPRAFFTAAIKQGTNSKSILYKRDAEGNPLYSENRPFQIAIEGETDIGGHRAGWYAPQGDVYGEPTLSLSFPDGRKGDIKATGLFQAGKGRDPILSEWLDGVSVYETKQLQSVYKSFIESRARTEANKWFNNAANELRSKGKLSSSRKNELLAERDNRVFNEKLKEGYKNQSFDTYKRDKNGLHSSLYAESALIESSLYGHGEEVVVGTHPSSQGTRAASLSDAMVFWAQEYAREYWEKPQVQEAFIAQGIDSQARLTNYIAGAQLLSNWPSGFMQRLLGDAYTEHFKNAYDDDINVAQSALENIVSRFSAVGRMPDFSVPTAYTAVGMQTLDAFTAQGVTPSLIADKKDGTRGDVPAEKIMRDIADMSLRSMEPDMNTVMFRKEPIRIDQGDKYEPNFLQRLGLDALKMAVKVRGKYVGDFGNDFESVIGESFEKKILEGTGTGLEKGKTIENFLRQKIAEQFINVPGERGKAIQDMKDMGWSIDELKKAHLIKSAEAISEQVAWKLEDNINNLPPDEQQRVVKDLHQTVYRAYKNIVNFRKNEAVRTKKLAQMNPDKALSSFWRRYRASMDPLHGDDPISLAEHFGEQSELKQAHDTAFYDVAPMIVDGKVVYRDNSLLYGSMTTKGGNMLPAASSKLYREQVRQQGVVLQEDMMTTVVDVSVARKYAEIVQHIEQSDVDTHKQLQSYISNAKTYVDKPQVGKLTHLIAKNAENGMLSGISMKAMDGIEGVIPTLHWGELKATKDGGLDAMARAIDGQLRLRHETYRDITEGKGEDTRLSGLKYYLAQRLYYAKFHEVNGRRLATLSNLQQKLSAAGETAKAEHIGIVVRDMQKIHELGDIWNEGNHKAWGYHTQSYPSDGAYLHNISKVITQLGKKIDGNNLTDKELNFISSIKQTLGLQGNEQVLVSAAIKFLKEQQKEFAEKSEVGELGELLGEPLSHMKTARYSQYAKYRSLHDILPNNEAFVVDTSAKVLEQYDSDFAKSYKYGVSFALGELYRNEKNNFPIAENEFISNIIADNINYLRGERYHFTKEVPKNELNESGLEIGTPLQFVYRDPILNNHKKNVYDKRVKALQSRGIDASDAELENWLSTGKAGERFMKGYYAGDIGGKAAFFIKAQNRFVFVNPDDVTSAYKGATLGFINRQIDKLASDALGMIKPDLTTLYVSGDADHSHLSSRLTELTQKNLSSFKAKALLASRNATAYEIGMQYMGKAHLYKAAMKMAGAIVLAPFSPLASSVLLAGAGKAALSFPVSIAGRVIENWTSAPRSYLLHEGMKAFVMNIFSSDNHKIDADRQMASSVHTFAEEEGMDENLRNPYKIANETKQRLKDLSSDNEVLKDKSIKHWQEKLFEGSLSDDDMVMLTDSAIERLTKLTSNPKAIIDRLKSYDYEPSTNQFINEHGEDLASLLAMQAEMKKQWLKIFGQHLYQKGYATKLLAVGLSKSEAAGKKYANNLGVQQSASMGAATAFDNGALIAKGMGDLSTGQHGGATRTMYQRDMLGRYMSMYGRFHKKLAVQMVSNIFDQLDNHIALRDAQQRSDVYGKPDKYVLKSVESIRYRDEESGIDIGKGNSYVGEYDAVRLAQRYAAMGAAFGALSTATGYGLMALLGINGIEWDTKEKLDMIGRYSGLQTPYSQGMKFSIESLFALMAIDADNVAAADITPSTYAKAHSDNVKGIGDLLTVLGNGKAQSQAFNALLGIGMDMAFLGARGYGASAGEQLGMDAAMKKAQADRIANILSGTPFVSTAYEAAKPIINTVATATDAIDKEKHGKKNTEDISVKESFEELPIYPQKNSDGRKKGLEKQLNKQKRSKRGS